MALAMAMKVWVPKTSQHLLFQYTYLLPAVYHPQGPQQFPHDDDRLSPQ